MVPISEERTAAPEAGRRERRGAWRTIALAIVVFALGFLVARWLGDGDYYESSSLRVFVVHEKRGAPIRCKAMRADGSALAGLRVEVDTESAPYSFRTDADGNAVLVFGAIPTGLWVGDLQIPYRDSIAMLLIVAK